MKYTNPGQPWSWNYLSKSNNQPNLKHQVLLEAQAEWTEVPNKGARKAEITFLIVGRIYFNDIFI